MKQFNPSLKLLSCGQGDCYERLGIEPHPKIILGGLTRSEHMPAEIPRFKGAKVAH